MPQTCSTGINDSIGSVECPRVKMAPSGQCASCGGGCSLMTAAASARVVVRFCGRGANRTEFADPLTWERLFEPVEELRGGASMIRGQAVACACSVSVGV